MITQSYSEKDMNTHISYSKREIIFRGGNNIVIYTYRSILDANVLL
jgi:hypothetical protein